MNCNLHLEERQKKMNSFRKVLRSIVALKALHQAEKLSVSVSAGTA